MRTPIAIVGGMRQEEIWDVDAAQRYDTPGTGIFAPEVLGPTADRLAELAGDGQALEFAIGTGRVAVPLAERSIGSCRSWPPPASIRFSGTKPRSGQIRWHRANSDVNG